MRNDTSFQYRPLASRSIGSRIAGAVGAVLAIATVIGGVLAVLHLPASNTDVTGVATAPSSVVVASCQGAGGGSGCQR